MTPSLSHCTYLLHIPLRLRLCLSFLDGSHGPDGQSIASFASMFPSVRPALCISFPLIPFHFLCSCCSHIGILWNRLLAQCHLLGTKDLGVFCLFCLCSVVYNNP